MAAQGSVVQRMRLVSGTESVDIATAGDLATLNGKSAFAKDVQKNRSLLKVYMKQFPDHAGHVINASGGVHAAVLRHAQQLRQQPAPQQAQAQHQQQGGPLPGGDQQQELHAPQAEQHDAQAPEQHAPQVHPQALGQGAEQQALPHAAAQPQADALPPRVTKIPKLDERARDTSTRHKLQKAFIAADKAVKALKAAAVHCLLGGSYAAFLAGNSKVPGDVDIDVHTDEDFAKAKTILAAQGFKAEGSQSEHVARFSLAIKAQEVDPSSKFDKPAIMRIELANISKLAVNSKTKPDHVISTDPQDRQRVPHDAPIPTPENMILNWLQRISEDSAKANLKGDPKSIKTLAKKRGVTLEKLQAAAKTPLSDKQRQLFQQLVS